MKRSAIKLLAFCLGVFFMGAVIAQEAEEKEKVNFKYGGFVKADYLFTQYNNGPYSGAGRDFHIPGTIPVGNGDVTSYTDFHVKESRFNFDVSTTVGGKKLRSFIELDFMLSPGGNEVVSNSFNPRVRHAFLEYDKFLFGQTWSTFMIVIIPDELDFLGAAEGLVFVRQPMIRATFGNWQVAIENPYSTYSTVDAAGDPVKNLSESVLLPELIGRYNAEVGLGNFSVAAMLRPLGYYDGSSKHNAIGYGITGGGKLDVGSKDDIRFVATVGSGLGRYVGINFVNASVMDGSQELKPIPTVSGYVAYLHHWSSKLRSSASLSYFMATNDRDLVGDKANDQAMSASVNLLYSPAKNLLFGVEPMYASRALVDGTAGDFFRLQLSVKYAFSFKTSVEK